MPDRIERNNINAASNARRQRVIPHENRWTNLQTENRAVIMSMKGDLHVMGPAWDATHQGRFAIHAIGRS